MTIPGGIQNQLWGGLNGNLLERVNPGTQGPKTMSLAELEQVTPKTVSLADLEKVAPKFNPALTQSAGNADAFGNTLSQFVGEVNAKAAAAGAAVGGVLSGQAVPLHQAVIAMEEAGVSFQLMVEVRNKLMEAYQELMRMQM